MSRGIKIIAGLALSVFIATSLTSASEVALRRAKNSLPLQSALTQGTSIPNLPPAWQARQLARPVKVAIAINGFHKGSENARLLDTFFRLLEGNRDIEIARIYTLMPDVNPRTLADYLRHNPDHGTWTDVQISSGDDWIEINGNRIIFDQIASFGLLPWDSDTLEAIVLCGDNPVDSGEIRGCTTEKGPQVIITGQTDLGFLQMESDGTLSSEGVNLGRPLVVGVNTSEESLNEKVLSLIPSTEANGLAIILKAIASGFDLTAVNSIRIDTPADGVDTVTQPSVTTALFHSLIPQLQLLGSTELTIDRMNLSVPRGGKHVAITFSVDEGITAEEVNIALQKLAEGELNGLLAVSDKDDILSSSYFIETESGRTYVGPSFVVDSRTTSVVKGSKGSETVVSLHGWASDYAGGRSIQDLLVKLGLANSSIGAVSVDQANITPQGAALISPSVPEQKEKRLSQPVRIAINGAGRIGRTILRLAVGNPDLDVVAINDLAMNVRQLAHLIELDTGQGRLRAEVRYGTDGFENPGDGIPWISINGKKIACLNMRDNLPWAKMGIDTVIESTGVFTHTDKAKQHLSWGARHVVVSAPADKSDTTMISFVPGVNDAVFEASGLPVIFSLASCTSNNVSATLIVLERAFQELRAQGKDITFKAVKMDTIHAITPTQNVMDNFGKSDDRMLAAQENVILTTSGAAREVPKLIPSLRDKMIVDSVRVGNQAGSVSILTVVLSEDSPYTAEEWIQIYREAAETYLQGILKVSESGRLMSAGDIVGVRETAVIDSLRFEVNGNTIKIFSWYDNETGFSTNLLEGVVRYFLMSANP